MVSSMTSRFHRMRPCRLLPVLTVLVSLFLPSESSAFIRRDLSPDAGFLAAETCRNVPVAYKDPTGEESVEVSDSGEVFWVIEKDWTGPLNPDVRRVSIGAVPVESRLFRTSRVAGDVRLKSQFSGANIKLEHLEKAAKMFWEKRPVGGLNAGESKTFWQRAPTEQESVIGQFLKDFTRRLKDAYNGETFDSYYLRTLMAAPSTIYNTRYVLAMGPYADGERGFLNKQDIDIGANFGERLYFYKGNLYTAAEMGNLAAGKNTTFAWGGIVGGGALIWAESSDVWENWRSRTWDERFRSISGSFRMNIRGGFESWREYPAVSVFNTFTPPPLFPTLNWSVWQE